MATNSFTTQGQILAVNLIDIWIPVICRFRESVPSIEGLVMRRWMRDCIKEISGFWRRNSACDCLQTVEWKHTSFPWAYNRLYETYVLFSRFSVETSSSLYTFLLILMSNFFKICVCVCVCVDIIINLLLNLSTTKSIYIYAIDKKNCQDLWSNVV